MKPLLLCVALAALVPYAAAQERPHVRELTLVPRTRGVQPGKTAVVALRMVLEPGWHVYWRNPGDSGLPVKVSWSNPPGVEGGAIEWPAPARIVLPPLANYGYEDAVVLPMPLRIPMDASAGSSLPLKAKVSWLVCKDVCIPGKATLTLDLPVSQAPPRSSRWAVAIDKALSEVPKPTDAWTATAHWTADKIVLKLRGPKTPDSALYFPYSQNALDNGKSQEFKPSDGGFALTLARSDLFTPGKDSLDGVIELDGDPAQAFEVSPRPEKKGAWAQAIYFAFFGGMILNLMPCVFPVLFLKILSLSHLSGAGVREARLHSHAYTAGILISFWALAGALLALRAAGRQLGWGFQLQSPGFLAFLAFLFFALALNLAGVYEIGASWMGIGQDMVAREGLAGAFFSGVLAVVVATPCTAPFMGTALGVALAAPAATAFLIFTALALGLALPYAVIAHFPALSRWVPRPGAWMASFKQLLSFPLFATALWLLSVVGLQSGLTAMVHALAFMLTLGFALWLYGKLTRAPAWAALALLLAGGATYGGAAAAASADLTSGPQTSQTIARPEWSPFSDEALTQALAAGRPVFVDFTAAWCITCQVNERLVLDRAPVREAFRDKNVLLLRADWTNRDAAIARRLEDFGRAGVPLYVLYRPGGAKPTILPQLLTQGTVLDSLGTL